MSEDGAAGRDGSLHGLHENIDTAPVESGNPARLHENTLAIHEIRVEQAQRSAVGCCVHSTSEQRSKLEKRRYPGFALLRRATPRRHDHDDGFAVRTANAPNRTVRASGVEAAMSAHCPRTALTWENG
jgi:hypothetical protein